MVQAYVFIHISGQHPADVLETIRYIPQVKLAHILLGPVDCIALIECPNHEELYQVIFNIRGIPGVTSTDTRYVYA